MTIPGSIMVPIKINKVERIYCPKLERSTAVGHRFKEIGGKLERNDV